MRADYNFRRSILPGLDFRAEVMMSPTAIPQISDLYLDILC